MAVSGRGELLQASRQGLRERCFVPGATAVGQQTRALRPGRRRHGERAALRFQLKHFVVAGDVNAGDGQGREDVQAAGAARMRRHVMAARQQEQWCQLGEGLHAQREFALQGGVGSAAVEGVAGEDREVDFLLPRQRDEVVEALQKVLHTPGHAALRVDGSVTRHAKVQVGAVQYAQRFVHGPILA